ncbi:uncharacterized protein [Antedon mediterranea]|uniref:uncharacterized protein n=1 Tax=Antedon mediterranea TaxID=105859 RepID=UPI003AF4D80E
MGTWFIDTHQLWAYSKYQRGTVYGVKHGQPGFTNQKIQQRALAGWLEHHKAKRSKTSVYKALEKAVAHKRLKKAWAVWKDRLQRAKFLQDQEVYALHFWAETLTHKMFERWKLRMREKQKEKDREVAADHLYNQFLVARCFFQGFLPYTMYRLEKKRRTAIAATSYIERLSTKYFHHWHTRWYTKKIMAEKSHQIKVMGQRAMLRRILIHWKFYIFLEQEKALKIKLATEHYQARLLTIGLRSFKDAVHIHKQKKLKEDIARNYQSTVLIKIAWNQWMLRCDEKDELKIVNQSRRAWSYYKKKTLRRCFGILQKYTTWRKHRKSQYVDADAFFAYKMLPKCLHCMHLYAKMRQEKRQRQIASEKFRRECLLGSVFFRWMFSYRASQDYRMMQRMAILHYDDQITRRNLKVWRKATQEKLSEEKKIETACQHYYSKLVLKMLSAWKTYTKLEFRSKNQDVLAYKHSVHQTTKKAWKAWAMYVARQQVKGHKKAKADVFYQQGLQRKVLEAWKTYHHGIMAVYEKVNAKKTRHDRHRLHEMFQHWRQTIQEMVVDRHKLQIADNMYAVKLKALVFKHWYHYTILHVGLRDDEDHREN